LSLRVVARTRAESPLGRLVFLRTYATRSRSGCSPYCRVLQVPAPIPAFVVRVPPGYAICTRA
jgi:hypothetical protein